MVKNKQQSEISLNTNAETLQTPDSPDNISFEAALKELELIVSQMESNQLPLEQSLSAYKRGTALLQFCQQSLNNVEQQVRILNESQQLQPYVDNQ
jgi:exodeoxyribonuclease VII small subunit